MKIGLDTPAMYNGQATVLVRSDDDAKTYAYPISHLIWISATPPGEAPLWVREKWVGLELPVLDLSHLKIPTDGTSFGVLSGAPVTGVGDLVPALLAFELLRKAAPDAYQWWAEYVPGNFSGEVSLKFDASVCRTIDARLDLKSYLATLFGDAEGVRGS